MNIKQSKLLRQQSGFTLLEMLVVLVIIGLLAGLVGPRLFGKVDASKQKTAQVQIKMLKGALQTMRLDIARFPTTEEGLDLLYAAPKNEKLKKRWKGPYLDEPVPVDPWDNAYGYQFPGSEGLQFLLYSLGSDGKPGGEGYAEDLGYLATAGK